MENINKNFAERRLYTRRKLRTEVTFKEEFGEDVIKLYSEDVSVGGIFLSSYLPIKVGSYVFISFRLPDHPASIEATGEVVRTVEERDGETKGGFAIRFVALKEVAAEAIRRFVSG